MPLDTVGGLRFAGHPLAARQNLLTKAAAHAGRAIAVACACAAFFGVAALVERAAPPYLPVLSPKQAHFDAHRDAYTAVFIGTSVVHRSVVPAVFDAEIEALGGRARAFNHGAPHLTLAEASLLVDRLVAARPRELRAVVLDLNLYAGPAEHHHFTSRHVAWHTPAETWFAFSKALDGKVDWASLGVDARAFGRRATAAGRLSDRFRETWDPSFRDDERDEDQAVVTDEGYQPLEALESSAVVTARRAAFLRAQSEYEASLRERLGRPAARRKLPEHVKRMLGRIVAKLRDAGLVPVLFEGPLLSSPYTIPGDLSRRAEKITFNDPARYPDLYAFENRFDNAHLSRAIAPAFTRIVAREYARVVAEVKSR